MIIIVTIITIITIVLIILITRILIVLKLTQTTITHNEMTAEEPDRMANVQRYYRMCKDAEYIYAVYTIHIMHRMHTHMCIYIYIYT